MAVITYEIATDIAIPHITIERRYSDGVLMGYRMTAHEGYVFYDSTANDTEFDPETMEERPVTYYYTFGMLPKNTNFENFHYVAVLRSTVDENYIFGAGDDNDHEVM